MHWLKISSFFQNYWSSTGGRDDSNRWKLWHVYYWTCSSVNVKGLKKILLMDLSLYMKWMLRVTSSQKLIMFLCVCVSLPFDNIVSHCMITWSGDLHATLCSVLSTLRIPSGTDGWMEYVPISDKKNITFAPPQRLKEGKTFGDEREWGVKMLR